MQNRIPESLKKLRKKICLKLKLCVIVENTQKIADVGQQAKAADYYESFRYFRTFEKIEKSLTAAKIFHVFSEDRINGDLLAQSEKATPTHSRAFSYCVIKSGVRKSLVL